LRDLLATLDHEIEDMAFERSSREQLQSGNWDSLFLAVVRREPRFEEAWKKVSPPPPSTAAPAIPNSTRVKDRTAPAAFPITGQCVEERTEVPIGPMQTIRNEAELRRAEAECEGRRRRFGR
jgi:hypothetical protein